MAWKQVNDECVIHSSDNEDIIIGRKTIVFHMT